jgi:hypothetical protein
LEDAGNAAEKLRTKGSGVRFLKQGLSEVRKKSELSKGVKDLKGMTSIGNTGLLHSDFPAQATGEKEDHVSWQNLLAFLP